MQISVHSTTRVIRQHGNSLGELDDHVIEDIDDEVWAAVEAAMPGHGGGVALSPDHSTITPMPEPAGYQAAKEAETQRAAALEALHAHVRDHPEDPTALLARALGLV